MIARGPEGIRHSARYLRDDLVPAAADPFLASDLRLIAQHFDIVAEDFDRLVDSLVCDREELEGFFAAALPHLVGPVRDAAVTALGDTVAGLRTTDLIARADRDMIAFIAVHRFLDEAVAKNIDSVVPVRDNAWRFLDAHLERRRYRAVG